MRARRRVREGERGRERAREGERGRERAGEQGRSHLGEPRELSASVDHPLLELEDEAASPATCIAEGHVAVDCGGHEGSLDAASDAVVVRLPEHLGQNAPLHAAIELGHPRQLAKLDDARVDAVNGRHVCAHEPGLQSGIPLSRDYNPFPSGIAIRRTQLATDIRCVLLTHSQGSNRSVGIQRLPLHSWLNSRSMYASNPVCSLARGLARSTRLYFWNICART